MSPYELVELINSGISASMEIVAIFISVLSAYLLVAYYFSDKLSSIELLLVSLMYSAFCLVLIIGAYRTLSGAMDIVSFAGSGNYTWGVQTTASVMVTSWILSLLFMTKRWRLR
jgi:hypothetical protein